MPTPSEREFSVFTRGEVRDDILGFLRDGLRALPDPETLQPFTEDTIRRATAPGSRFFTEADGIDLALQGIQKRDEFLAQQMRIDRAGSAYLVNYHGAQWGEEPLPETGGSGLVTATGTPGTTWIGSTTVPDSLATFGRDPAGNRYQVLISGSANGSGVASLFLSGIDGGNGTNPVAGTVITWSNPPPGSAPTATVAANFTGGGPAETNADFAARLASRVRNKPGAGNPAQMRAFARAANVSVEDAFVYPCAQHAGSVLVAVTQKRGTTAGPTGREPSVGVLTDVTAALVPPNSPNIPQRAHVVVLPFVGTPSDVVVQLSQRVGSSAGWADLEPFPAVNTGGAAVTITSVASQTDFQITAAAAGQLPQGATGPLAGVSLMVWDEATSAFESLVVATVEDLGGGVYRVLLTAAPTLTLATGQWVSPDMARRDSLAEAVVAYFDSLGPGEVVNLTTDVRGARAFRNPVPSEEYPSRAGQSLINFIGEGLGASLADSSLASITLQTPALPADPIDGPRMIVAGQFAVYDLP